MTLRIFKIAAWFFILLGSLSVRSQIKSFIDHYSTSDGLPDNRIRSIVKDDEGFMWIGSWAGISRFDGRNFVNFKSYPGDSSSLKSNRINEIVDDRSGFLWLRAYDNQIYRFNKRSQQFLSVSDLFQIKNIGFSKILYADKETVWLKSLDHGLFIVRNTKQPSVTRFAEGLEARFQLPSNHILFMHLDDTKTAWIGTAKGMVALSKQGNNGFIKLADKQFGKLIYTNVCKVDHTVWFTTAQGYLVSYNTRLKKINRYKLGDVSLNGLCVSQKDNRVYCTTQSGSIIAIDKNGTKQKTYQVSNGEALYSLFEDHLGLLWAEPESIGVFKLDRERGKARHFVQENQSNYLHVPEDYKVFEDNEGRVWTYMKGCGFGYYDREKDEIEYFHNHPRSQYRRFSNAVSALYYDSAGVLWLSTDTRGLEKIVFQRSDFKQNILKHGSFLTADNEVRGLLTDRKNRLWVASKAGELFVFENGKRLENLFINKPGSRQGIYSIFEDSKGRVWLGTKDNGLYMASPVNGARNQYKIEHYVNERSDPKSINTTTIYAIFEDSKKRIWVGSYGDGLILINEKNGRKEFINRKTSFKNYPKVHNKIRNIAEDKYGRIWVATTEGLVVFNPNSGSPDTYTFKVYKKKPGDIHSLGGGDVQSIFRDSRDNMWVCTSTGGLNKAVMKGVSDKITFENFSTKDGLPSDYILGCIEDLNGDLWLTTQNGISKFVVRTKKFENFGFYDGLSDIAFSEGAGTRQENGDLIFGSLAGYWTFNPKDIGKKKIRANLALTRFQVNNQEVLPGDILPQKRSINNSTEIELEHHQNTISIDFAVLDYRLGDNDNYVYRLLGFDESWQVSNGQKRATYTNLPPGRYVFEVRSQTEYLYDKVPQRSLTITISSPPWKTWWAYLIYLCVGMLLLVAGRKFALTLLRLRQRIAIERRVADLKSSFFTQVSHELRTPLTLILNPAEEILQSEKLSVKGTEYINVVVKNGRRMVRLVNQLLDLRKAQSGKAILKISEVEIISFIRGVVEYFQESIGHRNLAVNIQSDLKELLVWIDIEKTDIVVYNLLANAIKFSPDNGTIEIIIAKHSGKDLFRLEVADEGPGVLEDELEEIFELYYEGAASPARLVKGTGIGLALSKELVQLHKGTICAMNNSPQGLRVIVEMSLGKDHFDSENTQLVNLPVVHKNEDFVEDGFELSEVALNPNLQDRSSVLLVEDNDELRIFLANKLSEYYIITTAKDGEEGFKMANELLPNLILSDIMMPKVDGIQLLDQLKNNLLTSHIPVVLLTAKFSVQSQIEALNYGADYYISKPFQMDLLQTVIQSLIIQRKKLFEALIKGKNINELRSQDVVITSHDQQFLEKIIKIVDDRLADSDFNIDDVAESIGMSRSAFFKKFKSLTNSAPVEFVRETRLKRGKTLFESGEKNVSTVAYSVGFSDPKYFSTCFKARFNKRPTEYIKELARPSEEKS